MYLTGQRRVRKLPNSCCDTPHPTSAGIITFDEMETFATRLERFDWKLVGKKEMYIPYNSNRTLVPTEDSDVLGPKHLNPDTVRWELHRVWVVEAELQPGQRHTSPKSRATSTRTPGGRCWPIAGMPTASCGACRSPGAPCDGTSQGGASRDGRGSAA